MPFLVKPGDTIIFSEKTSKGSKGLGGCIATNSLTSTTPRALGKDSQSRYGKASISKEGAKKRYWKWNVPVWSYKYDGSFYKAKSSVEIQIEASEIEEELDISSLNVFPIKFASEEARSRLKNRGKVFWTCRERRFVSYNDSEGMYEVSLVSCQL
ncbi:hypothetical protein GQ44DRAFT_358600 [Phaeosphaeriaceae sp. PMI808]|nr:hypothetical protein GQ44DRAFT_358600 [Phaeosphaeriaceae sp. PMI808]